MSNQIYNYGSSYDGSGASSLYSLHAANPYLSDGGKSRHASGEAFAGVAADPVMYSSADRITRFSKAAGAFRYSADDYTGAGSFSAGKIGLGLQAAAGGSTDVSLAGSRRSVEALYHQSIMGSHNAIGQSEALYSSNSLVKRPRFESSLPIYPQRPGEKDCAHYMMTRTCMFGDACKFDHPIWVPEGGIPDWKEVPLVPTNEYLPERPGEPDCPYYMKTQKCKFGSRCKFNHPKDKLNGVMGETGGEGTENLDNSILPERPSEPPCSFYMKTGKCKFGANCKFNHPKDILMPPNGQDTDTKGKLEAAEQDDFSADGDSQPSRTYVPFTPALLHNSKGLPVRPGETDCPFYLKTGSCKYGATCRYNHPDRNAINPPLVASVGQAILSSSVNNLPIGVLNPTANLLQNFDLRSAHASLGIAPTVYPQRPGEIECDYYMKTGQCKFGERCRFHHPIDRSAPISNATQTVEQNVKLTLAGLPRREGATVCSYYMKTGTCRYGASCRFDHPPPGEAVAMAAMQGAGSEGESN
ncbi:zinc finger CCCH domain-containing protein 8 [Typha angustifolia]|uniref:zinc finger CCCH domain-containing protein 8 n=1 Tax=Typha angustifolia TaxID=59011 RepID=UPI003C30378F